MYHPGNTTFQHNQTRTLCNFFRRYFNGFRISYQVTAPNLHSAKKNLGGTYAYPQAVEEYLHTEVDHGRLAVPMDHFEAGYTLPPSLLRQFFNHQTTYLWYLQMKFKHYHQDKWGTWSAPSIRDSWRPSYLPSLLRNNSGVKQDGSRFTLDKLMHIQEELTN